MTSVQAFLMHALDYALSYSATAQALGGSQAGRRGPAGELLEGIRDFDTVGGVCNADRTARQLLSALQTPPTAEKRAGENPPASNLRILQAV